MKLIEAGSVQLPTDVGGALPYLNELILQLQNAVDEVNRSFFTITYSEPDKPRNLMIRFADGTEWDPGMGAGLYQYREDTDEWVPMSVQQWG